MDELNELQLPYLCKAFARFLNEQSKDEPCVVLLAAAFLSYELSRGEVYLDLKAFFETEEQFNDIDISSLKPYFKNWEAAFSQSKKIMSSGEGNSPLVWDKENQRLYLRRYWTYQQTVDEAIAERLAPIRPELPAEITAQLHQLFPPSNITPDWQKIACAVALRSKFSIITGGPGTGKTTTLTKLLILLVSLMRLEKDKNFKPKILLAAPTGKAANRVSESINNALEKLETITPEIKALIPKKASTIHRLLGSSATSRLKKHNRHNPLIADIVIVDEASMIDLEMMAALFEALPENTQLILLGDKDQLSSVEPGYVFGNLCLDAEKDAYNQETLDWISKYTDEKIEPKPDYISAINQQTVMLKYSYRFNQDSGIGQLANFVNETYKDNMFDTDAIFTNHPKDLHKINNFDELRTVSKANYGHYKNEIENPSTDNKDKWAKAVLNAFDEFRILCAVHESEFGTNALNDKVQDWLFPNTKSSFWFEGRPVMITKNDYNLGLMNGDVGIALKKDGNLQVAFFSNNDSDKKISWFSTSRISDFQTAFALTVHKSQGSEFEHTLFVLPSDDVKVLTKELYYTAITRAKSEFTLLQGRSAKWNINHVKES
ncbi:MAG: exodeoxyribonuclease V subunit alpha [Methylococcaceae bacterium]